MGESRREATAVQTEISRRRDPGNGLMLRKYWGKELKAQKKKAKERTKTSSKWGSLKTGNIRKPKVAGKDKRVLREKGKGILAKENSLAGTESSNRGEASIRCACREEKKMRAVKSAPKGDREKISTRKGRREKGPP